VLPRGETDPLPCSTKAFWSGNGTGSKSQKLIRQRNTSEPIRRQRRLARRRL